MLLATDKDEFQFGSSIDEVVLKNQDLPNISVILGIGQFASDVQSFCAP